jgi:DNA-binding NarL/FixJ family response regulator
LDNNPSAMIGVRASLSGQLVEIAPSTERKSPGDGFGLTPLELQIVSKLVECRTNKRIAADLAIREEDVKRHLANLFTKLDVADRLELVLFAVYHQLSDYQGLDPGSPLSRRAAAAGL